jgi:glycosyltransferase involved in cell wall biosynthesis
MRLAVEAQQLRRDQRGIGRYVRRLLAAMHTEDAELAITLGVRSDEDAAAVSSELRSALGDALTVVRLDEWQRRTFDVAWYPWNFVRVRPAAGAIVPTLHDLAPMRRDIDGRWWKLLKRARARRAYEHAARSATLVLTGARVAAEELARTLPLSPERIVVVPHAADEFATLGDAPAAEALLASLGVRGPFVLALASRERRKNLGIVWRAMDALHDTDDAMPLVLAGGAAEALPERPWVRRAGFVPDAVLATLYARATAVVVPSRYEGFGLPALEAMTAGGAVVCADASTLPEVAGDGALYFPPDDASTLATHLRTLRREPATADGLRARGVQRAAGYSWRASARATLAVFAHAAAAAAQTR